MINRNLVKKEKDNSVLLSYTGLAFWTALLILNKYRSEWQNVRWYTDFVVVVVVVCFKIHHHEMIILLHDVIFLLHLFLPLSFLLKHLLRMITITTYPFFVLFISIKQVDLKISTISL